MNFVLKSLKILVVFLIVVGLGFMTFWFLRPTDVSFEEHKADIPHSQFSKFLDVDGIKLHYQEKGTGTPLVLIHGFGGSTYSWRDVFKPLAENFRVIAVDLKGFGFSEKPDGDYTRREQAVLVRKFLDKLKIEKAWFAGVSMGGEISLNIALQNQEVVKGLILIDSSGIVSLDEEDEFSIYDVPFIGKAVLAIALRSDSPVLESLERNYYDKSKITDEIIKIYHLPLQTRNGQRAVIRATEQWDLHPIENDLSKIKAPTLIIWGAEDVTTPLEGGKIINKSIENSKLVVFENVGHLPQEESPEKTIEEILKFTDKLE